MNVLFDTCVILDHLMERGGYAEHAEALMEKAAEGDIRGMITVKELTDIHYVLKNVFHDEVKVRGILLDLLDILTLSDSMTEDAVNAIFSPVNDYEDALMIMTAERIRADVIVTRNTRDYRLSSIPVYSPEEFLEHLSFSNA